MLDGGKMKKRFNVTGLCIPSIHYMVDTDKKIEYIIEKYVEEGAYFTINRARQYGKTTTLELLYQRLSHNNIVLDISFEGREDYFSSFTTLAAGLFYSFNQSLKRDYPELAMIFATKPDIQLPLQDLSGRITQLCERAGKHVILMVDEVDKAADNQIFLSLLGMLRDKYLDQQKGRALTFHSVILAGVHDIKNLRSHIRPEEAHSYNSPWNIAADFDLDMGFDVDGIAGMLEEYERDHATGMEVLVVAQLIYDYTGGYPFLVSRMCQLIDKNGRMWTREGINDAIKHVLAETNPLFDDLLKKLTDYPELKSMLYDVLFRGQVYPYNPDNAAIRTAAMFGLIKERMGQVEVANRIFETRLYNYFLSEELMRSGGNWLGDASQFVRDGYLDMDMVVRKFVDYYTEIYADGDAKFLEENGRILFLLYLKPIINGTGNYYVEARTRNLKRTDIVVDYHGQQYIIESKIWHGNGYNKHGEEQLADYLEDYGLEKGYLISFCFNKNKKIGVKTVLCAGKTIIEAVV